MTPRTAISISAAVAQTDSLARLYELGRLSQQQLTEIRPTIPAAMFTQIQAGPIHGDEWCLLVSSATVASKLRQLTPMLLATLLQAGYGIKRIRLKVQLRAYSR